MSRKWPLLALVLCACAANGPWLAARGQYADYHNYIAKTTQGVYQTRMPPETAVALSNCVGDLEIAQIAPADLKVLDAAARGEKPAPAPLVKEALERSDRVLAGSDADLREKLRPYCPEVIARYGQYLGGGAQAASAANGQWTYRDDVEKSVEDPIKLDIKVGIHPDVPPEVLQRMAECVGDLAVASVTPAELSRLDAIVSGRAPYDPELMGAVNLYLGPSIERINRGDYAPLEPYCPNDIPSFRKYIR